MESPPRVPLTLFNDTSSRNSSNYDHSPPATLPGTPSGTHRRPIPSAGVSIAQSYAQSFTQWEPGSALRNIVAFPMATINDPLRIVTPRPMTESESSRENYRTPPSVYGPDPFGMEREVESDPEVIEVLGEKNETIQTRLHAAAEREKDWCVGCGRWFMKIMRAHPKIHEGRGGKTTKLGIGPGGREEEMGAFIAEGCVRTWGKWEMRFTIAMLVVVMNLLYFFEAGKPVILMRATEMLIAESGLKDANIMQIVNRLMVLMQVVGTVSIIGLTKLANSNSRPTVFFVGVLLCLVGVAHVSTPMDSENLDDVSPHGTAIYALGVTGVKVAATIIVTDITTPVWRVLYLSALQFTVPIWEILAPWIDDLMRVSDWRILIWIYLVVLILFSTPLVLALFIFSHRAAELGYTPHTHRAYGWSVCDFRTYWNTFLLFTGRYDTFGCLFFTLSAFATAALLKIEQPESWTLLSPTCYYWSLGVIAFLMMAGFIAWEQYVNPELMFEFLLQLPGAAVAFPEPPQAVLEVRHDEKASPLDERAEYTAAIVATKKREEKLGLFRNNGRGVISPTLLSLPRALGFLGVAFCSAFVLAVGLGLESESTSEKKYLAGKDIFKDISNSHVAISVGFFSALLIALIIPIYRRVYFPIVFGLILLCTSTMLPFFQNTRGLHVMGTAKETSSYYNIAQFATVILRAGYGMIEIPLLVGAQRECITHSDETIVTGLILFLRELGTLAGQFTCDWSAREAARKELRWNTVKELYPAEFQQLVQDGLGRQWPTNLDMRQPVRVMAVILATIAMVMAVASIRDLDISKSPGSGVLVIGGKKTPAELWMEALEEYAQQEKENEWKGRSKIHGVHGESRSWSALSDNGAAV